MLDLSELFKHEEQLPQQVSIEIDGELESSKNNSYQELVTGKRVLDTKASDLSLEMGTGFS